MVVTTPFLEICPGCGATVYKGLGDTTTDSIHICGNVIRVKSPTKKRKKKRKHVNEFSKLKKDKIHKKFLTGRL